MPAVRQRRLLHACAAVAGLLLLVAAVASALRPPPASAALVTALGLATAAAASTRLALGSGVAAQRFGWTEPVVVLGVALLRPEHLVLTSLAVVVAGSLGRWPARRLLCAVAAHSTGVALAAGAAHLVQPPSWGHPGASAVGLAAAGGVFALWTAAAHRLARVLGEDLPLPAGAPLTGVLVVAAGVSAALLCLAAGRQHADLLLTGTALLAAAALAYRGHLRVLHEREGWLQLEAASREMGGLDEQRLPDVALARAAVLLGADEVELCLHRGARGPDEVHVGGPGGRRLVCHEPRQAGSRYAVTAYVDADGTVTETCVQVPLRGRDEQVGVLRLRLRGDAQLAGREQQLLRAYAQAVSANLDNARLYAAVREQAARHEQAALHDPLTGLANRALLGERVEQALTDRSRPFAVLLLDLDRFKQVNDVHGHAAGDRLLCVVADRMRGAVRADDLVCRLGGDEFAVLLRDPAAVDVTVERLAALLHEPVDVGGGFVTVGASIGVALCPEHGTTPEALLAHADQAMYAEKAGRRAARDHVVTLSGPRSNGRVSGQSGAGRVISRA